MKPIRTALRSGRMPSSLVLLLAVAAVLIPACGGDDGTSPPGTRIVFEPAPGNLSITAADEITLRVLVNGDPVRATFRVDGEEVATADAYVFVPQGLGTVVLDVRADVDGAVQTATWNVSVGASGLRPTPNVSVFEASLAPVPGGIDLRWERPAEGRTDVEIVSYEIAYATAPFTAEQFDEVELLVVDSVPPTGPITQRERVEGLVERQDYVFRIRAVDRVGRRSEPSASTASRATGAYRLHGRVRSLRPDGRPVVPLANVVVNVGDRFQVTENDGLFDLPALPDTGQVVMTVAEQSGAQYYEIVTDPLDPVDREFDLILLQNGVVEFLQTRNGSTELVALSRLEFFRILTGSAGASAANPVPLTTWEQYPVPLYLHEDVRQTDEDLVDFRAALTVAAETWNEEAGETLFEIVDIDEPYPIAEIPVPGTIYLPEDDSVTAPTFGRVTLRRPEGAVLFEDFVVPETMTVGFRPGIRVNSLLRKICSHELGHVLGLRHTSPGDLGTHVMIAVINSSSREFVSEEEAFAARFVRYVAGRVEMHWFREPSGSGE